jgi:hypothetical protein
LPVETGSSQVVNKFGIALGEVQIRTIQ